MQDIQRLLQIASIPNIADTLSADELGKLGGRIVRDYEKDEASRAEWKKRTEKAMDMALQVAGKRPQPLGPDYSADITLPYLTVAALQFHARAYPAVVQNGQVVKGKVSGEDPTGQKEARAERLAKHMNYQLAEEMAEWDEQMDALLLALPIEGCEFKKTYYEPMKGRNVSEWVRPADFVVHYGTKTLDDCPRMTHILPDYYPHVIAEKMRAGIWREVDLRLDSEDDEEEKPQCILEQHRLEDFDGDGVKEPYIITVHKETKEVLRIKARWEPTGIIVHDGENVHPAFVQEGAQVLPHERLHEGCRLVKVEGELYFTKYSFIPAPDGGFYDIGFGQLVGPMSEAADSIINRLLDSGTLSNLPMGFIGEGLKFANQSAGTGEVRFKAGEFKKIKSTVTGNISDQIHQFKFPEPSMVLFSLLGFVTDQMTSITAVKDIMTGGDTGQNTPVGTTMALIEQGLKVFSAIYKRVYRALGHELRRIRDLNAIYLPVKDYFRVVDSPDPIEIQIMDYQGDETDVQPVADPTVATTMQRMAKAQFAMGLRGDPHINPGEVTKMVLEAADLPTDRLFVEQPPQPPPDPKMIETQAKVEKMAAETKEIYAKIMEMAQNLQTEETKTRTEQFTAMVNAFEKIGPAMALLEEMNGRGMGAMEASPGDAGVFGQDQGIDAGMQGMPPVGPGQF